MALTAVGFDGTVNETQDALRSRFQGNSLPVVYSRDDLAVTIDTGAARNVRVAAGDCWVPGVMISNSAAAFLQFDIVPTAGQSRWDALVLRVNWSTNTVTLTKVNGTAAAAPAEVLPPGLTYNPGVLYDYVLALVKVTAGSTNITTLSPWRLWSSYVYMADSLAPLTNAPMGTEVVLRSSGKRYRYLLDASNNPTWVQQGMPTVVGTGAVTPAVGWAMVTSSPNRYIVDANGIDVEYQACLRRSGATLRFDPAGSLGDTTVCTLTGPKPDYPNAIGATFRVRGGVATNSTQIYAAFGYIHPNGSVVIESGPSNAYLTQQTTATTISLVLTTRFRRAL